MPNVSVAFGAILIAVGAITFLVTGAAAPTALIPAGFGLILLALGMIARNPPRRKMAMHIAAAVGLFGFLGGATGIPKMIRHLSGDVIQRPVAAAEQTIMSLVCLLFVALCVRSFVNARRSKAAGT